LKPSNIFLFKDGQVKIGDLNASKEQNDEGVNYSARATPFIVLQKSSRRTIMMKK